MGHPGLSGVTCCHGACHRAQTIGGTLMRALLVQKGTCSTMGSFKSEDTCCRAKYLSSLQVSWFSKRGIATGSGFVCVCKIELSVKMFLV